MYIWIKLENGWWVWTYINAQIRKYIEQSSDEEYYEHTSTQSRYSNDSEYEDVLEKEYVENMDTEHDTDKGKTYNPGVGDLDMSESSDSDIEVLPSRKKKTPECTSYLNNT